MVKSNSMETQIPLRCTSYFRQVSARAIVVAEEYGSLRRYCHDSTVGCRYTTVAAQYNIVKPTHDIYCVFSLTSLELHPRFGEQNYLELLWDKFFAVLKGLSCIFTHPRRIKNKVQHPPPLALSCQFFRLNGITREIEEHLANLRASPRERQALEERVHHHLSKESQHCATRHDGALPKVESDMSLCSNDSFASLTSDGELTQGRIKKRHRRRKGGRGGGGAVGDASRRRLSASTRAAEASGRVLAQALHAQGVVRRKR